MVKANDWCGEHPEFNSAMALIRSKDEGTLEAGTTEQDSVSGRPTASMPAPVVPD